MALVKWNPGRDLLDIEREFSKLFNEFDRRFGLGRRNDDESGYDNAVWSPLADIIEDKDNFYLHLDLPGIKKEDVKISFADGELRISGERKQKQEEKNTRYHRVERSYGKYFRSFSLPNKVDADKISAEFTDGQLEVTIPKTEESKPREISVKIK